VLQHLGCGIGRLCLVKVRTNQLVSVGHDPLYRTICGVRNNCGSSNVARGCCATHSDQWLASVGKSPSARVQSLRTISANPQVKRSAFATQFGGPTGANKRRSEWADVKQHAGNARFAADHDCRRPAVERGRSGADVTAVARCWYLERYADRGCRAGWDWQHVRVSARPRRTRRHGGRAGTVTLIEICSGSVVFGDMAMEQSGAVGVSGGSVEFGNLTPDRKALSHLGSPSGCAEPMSSWSKMRRDAAKGRQELLGMPQ